MKIALVGNQNSGKTTLFNVLTGMNAKIGNWPGVTIEKKTGIVKNTRHEITDLPGIYSLSPYTLEEVYVAKTPHEKALQRALMQYFIPKNYDLVYEALKKSGRNDLIGTSKKCLIKPKQGIGNNYRVKENDFKRKKTIN